MKRPAKPAKSIRRAKKTCTATTRPAKSQAANRSPSSPTPSNDRPDGKLEIVIAMLRSTKGATIESLSKATGWQAHSVRGAISGAIKKKRGLVVTSEKLDGVRTYHITG